MVPSAQLCRGLRKIGIEFFWREEVGNLSQWVPVCSPGHSCSAKCTMAVPQAQQLSHSRASLGAVCFDKWPLHEGYKVLLRPINTEINKLGKRNSHSFLVCVDSTSLAALLSPGRFLSPSSWGFLKSWWLISLLAAFLSEWAGSGAQEDLSGH